MPGQALTSNISLPSAIQIDSATFVDLVVTSTIRCNQLDAGTITSITISLGSVAVTSDLQVTGIASANRLIATSNIQGIIGSFNRLIVASNIQGIIGSFNRLEVASNIQAVAGSFSGSLVVALNASFSGAVAIGAGAGSLINFTTTGAASFASTINVSGNVTVTGAGSFRVATPGVVTLAVGTAALSSDLSTQGDLPSNSIRFVAVGTVLQVYFNQTASVILRGVINLATF